MQRNLSKLSLNALTVLLFISILTATGFSADDRALPTSAGDPKSAKAETATAIYKWNLSSKELPLLGLNAPYLAVGFDQSLTYSAAEFDFLIFKALTLNQEHRTYLLPIMSRYSRSQSFIDFIPVAANFYVSADGGQLQDRGPMKVVKTTDGTKYLFVRHPNGDFKCAVIRDASGRMLNLLYTADGLLLHGLVDSIGRTITFNYGRQGIESVTQTWTANSLGFTKTWTVGNDNTVKVSGNYAHTVLRRTDPMRTRAGKLVPANALVNTYTEEMAASDKLLAHIFGGPNALVAGNGFEPAGLAASYPLYRGDIVGDDGEVRRGHLSFALHIYGSADGTGESPLYVPAGFTSYSGAPSPTDAAVTFYYPRLGNLTDVTLAVFHIADFQMTPEGDRIRIGNIGGPGGASPLYRHSHIEFYRGNVGLPPSAARAGLRVVPASVFVSQ